MLRDYPFDYLEKHLPLFCGLSSKCFEVLTKYTKNPSLLRALSDDEQLSAVRLVSRRMNAEYSKPPTAPHLNLVIPEILRESFTCALNLVMGATELMTWQKNVVIQQTELEEFQEVRISNEYSCVSLIVCTLDDLRVWVLEGSILVPAFWRRCPPVGFDVLVEKVSPHSGIRRC
jgi:hypothetical protein